MWSLCWQAAPGRDFLATATLATRIKERLISAHQYLGWVLIDFVLMPEEIHAIAQIGEGEVAGSIARSVNHILSRWVREAQTLRGPVLAVPLQAAQLESGVALRQEVRMLAWRPVRRRLCATATHYPHGALRAALGITSIPGFDARPLRRCFGSGLSESRAALRACIRLRPTDEEWRVWELTRGLELATSQLGEDLAKTVPKAMSVGAASLIAAGGGYGIDGALGLLEAWVGQMIHPTGELDMHHGSGMLAARGRALVACLATHHGLCSAASVARHFDRAKSTLSEQMKASRERPVDCAILATPLRRILEEGRSR